MAAHLNFQKEVAGVEKMVLCTILTTNVSLLNSNQ